MAHKIRRVITVLESFISEIIEIEKNIEYDDLFTKILDIFKFFLSKINAKKELESIIAMN